MSVKVEIIEFDYAGVNFGQAPNDTLVIQTANIYGSERLWSFMDNMDNVYKVIQWDEETGINRGICIRSRFPNMKGRKITIKVIDESDPNSRVNVVWEPSEKSVLLTKFNALTLPETKS